MLDVRSMFSKSVQRTPPAPQPQQQQSAAPANEADFVDVSSETDEKLSSPPSRREGVVRSINPILRQEGLGESKVNSLLAELGFDAEEAATLLRQELIAERSRGSHEGSLADWKHAYGTSGPNTLSISETSYTVAAIAGGTTVSTRTTNTIALRKARIKLFFNRIFSATPTAAFRDPNIIVVIYRDKIPVTPGTPPTVHGTDANPPASTTFLFSQLGVAASTNPAAVACMVRNPITEDAYHIYEVRHVKIPIGGFTYTGTTLGMPNPYSKVEHFDIDLNMVQQKYASYAATASDINNIYICVFADHDYTNMGITDSVSAVIDLEFMDLQV